MKVSIKRIDFTLPLPKYHTSGSVAFDLYARVTITAKPFEPIVVPANIIVKVPSNYVLILASRSSTPKKKSLMIANSIGIIDQDYHGETDEIGVQVLNFSKKNVLIKKGERIAQAMLVKIAKVSEFVEANKMNSKSRGGFGSTG